MIACHRHHDEERIQWKRRENNVESSSHVCSSILCLHVFGSSLESMRGLRAFIKFFRPVLTPSMFDIGPDSHRQTGWPLFVAGIVQYAGTIPDLPVLIGRLLCERSLEYTVSEYEKWSRNTRLTYLFSVLIGRGRLPPKTDSWWNNRPVKEGPGYFAWPWNMQSVIQTGH